MAVEAAFRGPEQLADYDRAVVADVVDNLTRQGLDGLADNLDARRLVGVATWLPSSPSMARSTHSAVVRSSDSFCVVGGAADRHYQCRAPSREKIEWKRCIRHRHPVIASRTIVRRPTLIKGRVSCA
ncbi:hypothetical protein [Methylocystis sp.]|uniref:hypothetical protein n=1 Tax=Methylocystis sp. TaxID=1911079 RepID=UPI0027354853|nr:hypothetical protein [Methylocystis sp.]MDP3555257.1 hypothetical protein [Methylocystis sp.]